MRRSLSGALLACLALSYTASPAAAAVNVSRRSDENPVVEVARSTIYGGLAGLVVGGALAWAIESDDSGDIVRWCFVGGTMLGLGAGVYFVSHRAEPDALLEVEDGELRLAAPLPERAGDGTLQVRLARVSF